MKAINTKKIVALTAGAAMVGATIFGAVAADLSQYPAPFITDGAFDGAIVVGELAKSTDVIGSIELAAGLQAAAVKTTPVVVGSGTSSIDKGVAIDKTGTHLALGRFLQFVQDTPLDESDLPTLLVDGTVDEDEGDNKNTIDYTQELRLFSNSGQVIYTQDDDDAPTAGTYLFFADNANMYNYTLDFDEDWDYSNDSASEVNDDFETAKISLLGKEYTFTEVTTVSGTNKAIDKITLLAGDTTRWMTEAEPLTREIAGAKHTFVLTDVNEDETKCGISVDGTIQWVDVGSTKTVNGIQIGATDAIVTHSAGKDVDVCEVNLGATELELENSNEVKLNGVDIDGTTVTITSSMGSSGNTFSALNILFEPDDDIYLAKGDKYPEPVFDAFTFYFDGLSTEKTEPIDLKATGNSAALTFLNNDNKEVKIEWDKNNSDILNLGTGSTADDRLYLEGQACSYVSSITECEGAQFLRITSGGEAHVLELLDFDSADDKIKLKDVTYGSTSEDDFTLANATGQFGTSYTVDLGSGAGQVTLTIIDLNRTNVTSALGTANALNFTEISGNSNIAETSLNDVGGITFSGIAANGNISGFTNDRVFTLTEDSEDGIGAAVIGFSLSVDTADDDINVGTPVMVSGNTAFHGSAVQASEADDDHEYYVTNWSTIIYYDQEDDDFATVEYPETYRYGQAFVGETEAKITASGGTVESVEVQQIPVGSAKFDKDIADWTAQNLIVVGGPCANTVAAALMGNPADCAAGFKEGEATIKLYTASTGKVSLLVAGYSGLDTRRATQVLARYKDWSAQLKGTEVTVKGTTLADTTVMSVA